MNRQDIDFLISLTNDYEKHNAYTQEKNEDICGWEIGATEISHRNQPHFDTTSAKLQTLKDRFKPRQTRNSTYDYSKAEARSINISPSNFYTKKEASTLRNNFFPKIKNSVQAYTQDKSMFWKKFDHSVDRYILGVQDKSLRITSATPVMLVRRKNLYY